MCHSTTAERKKAVSLRFKYFLLVFELRCDESGQTPAISLNGFSIRVLGTTITTMYDLSSSSSCITRYL